MTRVLLINPPSPEQLGGPLVGLQYVAASLLEAGCEVRVIDAAARRFPHDAAWIAAQAEAFAPQIIGFTLYTTWVWHAYRLVERFLGRFPVLVAGGPHASGCPEETLCHGFDVAVIGEGEEPIRQLVECVEGRLQWDQVRGICYRDRQGRIHRGGEPEAIGDLDRLAFPHRALPLFDPAWYGEAVRAPIANGIVSSRGCPARCTFCANYGAGRGYRHRSAGNVVEEIEEYHSRYGATFFPFWDDAFTAAPDRVFALCDAMERQLDFRPSWTATTRVTQVRPGLLRAMMRAGLLQLNFGVESGDDEILRAIRKGIRTEQVERALKVTKEAGLRTSCNFMFGFPEETPRTLERTLRFMERIAPLTDFFSPAGVLIPMPGTPIYERHHLHYGFTGWWLREEFARDTTPPDPRDRALFYQYYTTDRVLDLDFFHYSEEIRTLMRECLRFKAEHNLRKMGLLEEERAAGTVAN